MDREKHSQANVLMANIGILSRNPTYEMFMNLLRFYDTNKWEEITDLVEKTRADLAISLEQKYKEL